MDNLVMKSGCFDSRYSTTDVGTEKIPMLMTTRLKKPSVFQRNHLPVLGSVPSGSQRARCATLVMDHGAAAGKSTKAVKCFGAAQD